jgi:hypothetical protein
MTWFDPRQPSGESNSGEGDERLHGDDGDKGVGGHDVRGGSLIEVW